MESLNSNEGNAFLFARNDGLTAEQKSVASIWSNFDDDLQDADPAVADYVLSRRVAYSHNDLPRYDLKHDEPDDVVVYKDIPYIDDGKRAHLLDVSIPKDALYRGCPIPVVLEIHGGAFIYGFKEINRSHAIELARKGYAVVSPNYTLYPGGDFVDEMEDLSKVVEWVQAEGARYLLDVDQMFATGDSAGAVDVLYLVAIEHNPDFAKLIGVRGHGASFKALGLKSAMTNIDNVFDRSATDTGELVEGIRPFYERLYTRLNDTAYSTTKGLVAGMGIPPVWMATSTDDFLESSSLELAMMLRDNDVDHQLIDCRAQRNQSLPHNFMVGMPWLPESKACLDSMVSFFDEHQAPRRTLLSSV